MLTHFMIMKKALMLIVQCHCFEPSYLVPRGVVVFSTRSISRAWFADLLPPKTQALVPRALAKAHEQVVLVSNASPGSSLILNGGSDVGSSEGWRMKVSAGLRYSFRSGV